MTSLLCFLSVHVMYTAIKKMLLKRQQFSENKVGLYSCCILTLSSLKHMLQSDYTLFAHSQGGEQLTLCWWHFFSQQTIMLFVSSVIMCSLLLTLSYCRGLWTSRMSRHAYTHKHYEWNVMSSVLGLCHQLLRLYSGSDRWMNDCGALLE